MAKKRLISKGQEHYKVPITEKLAQAMSDTTQRDSTRVEPQKVIAADLRSQDKAENSQVADTPPPATTVSDLQERPWYIYKEGWQDDGSYNLPDDVVIKGDLPRSNMNIPVYVYQSDLSRRMYEDRNKAGRDIALGMAAVAAAPYVVPYIGSIMRASDIVLTPGKLPLRILQVATRKAAPTFSRTLGTIGDAWSTGYWTSQGAKHIGEAIKNPEKLTSWTDYAQLAGDVAMTASPVLHSVKYIPTISHLAEEGKLVPTFKHEALWWLRRNNIPYNVANLGAKVEGKVRGWLGGFDYMDPTNNAAEEVRQSLYKHWNPLAGRLQRSKSWIPKAEEKAIEGIQYSMDKFNKKYPLFARPNHGDYTGDLPDAQSYIKGRVEYSYLPYSSDGSLNAGYNGQTGHNGIDINMNNMYFPRQLRSTEVHEGNHGYNYWSKRGGSYNDPKGIGDINLEKAYPVDDPTSLGGNAFPDSWWEKRAVNAQVLHYLGVNPEQVSKIPDDKFIKLTRSNLGHAEVRTIIDDMIDQHVLPKGGYGHIYRRTIKGNFDKEIQKFVDKNKRYPSEEEVQKIFDTFAGDYVDAIKKALSESYKKGGKLWERNG